MPNFMTRIIRNALIGTVAIAAAAGAWSADRSGAEVVVQVCSACHADGKDGAPRIGDMTAWAQRAQGGFDKLSENAISGKNKMPAHGGNSTLTDLEITRAIAAMLSGGLAADPAKPFSKSKTIEGDVLVTTHCSKCHEAGKDGAPRLQVFADWKPRLGKGIDALVLSTVSGHNKMPSRAGLPGLSDVDLRNAVTYMVVHSTGVKAVPAK